MKERNEKPDEAVWRRSLKSGSVVRAVWNMNGTFGMADAEVLEIHNDFAVVSLKSHEDNWLGAGTVLALPFEEAYDFGRNHGIYPIHEST